ncbi:MAG: type II toxin-antitoxin system MqsA family antitoxin [Sedimentisphaerales bacterium]|nr:type II toxin-antitoxin system MqsA family antitoxin [Sedimentisphaerales bacterium]
MKKKCPICGAPALIEKTGDFCFEPPANIPGGTIVVPNSKWEECEVCKEVILPAELIENLDKQRYVRLGLLSPVEIKTIREKAGLTQSQISRKLGVGEKTYTRWESGKLLQNKSSDNLIRLFDLDSSSFEWLDLQREIDGCDSLRSYFHNFNTGSIWNEITAFETVFKDKDKHSLQAA